MQMEEIEEGIEGIESKDLEDETVEGRRWGERVSVYRVFIFHVFLFRLLLYQTFLSLSLSFEILNNRCLYISIISLLIPCHSCCINITRVYKKEKKIKSY